MIFELSVGFGAAILAMMIHLGATILVIHAVRPFEYLLKSSPYGFIAIALILTNLILFTTHMISVGMWASIYMLVGLTESYSDAFYSAFITNTTLGLGDVVPDARTRLLAPLTATSGILMIGWSTAMFIYVIQSCLPHIARRD